MPLCRAPCLSSRSASPRRRPVNGYGHAQESMQSRADRGGCAESVVPRAGIAPWPRRRRSRGARRPPGDRGPPRRSGGCPPDARSRGRSNEGGGHRPRRSPGTEAGVPANEPTEAHAPRPPSQRGVPVGDQGGPPPSSTRPLPTTLCMPRSRHAARNDAQPKRSPRARPTAPAASTTQWTVQRLQKRARAHAANRPSANHEGVRPGKSTGGAR